MKKHWNNYLRARESGFTLIEILMAIGIFAAASVILVSSVATSMRITVEDDREVQVALLAHNKLVELETEFEQDLARGKFPDEVSEEGNFEEPFEDYVWSYSVRKVDIPVMDTGDAQSASVQGALTNIMKKISESVRELKVEVVWKDPGDADNQKDVSLTTHIVDIK